MPGIPVLTVRKPEDILVVYLPVIYFEKATDDIALFLHTGIQYSNCVRSHTCGNGTKRL